MYEWLIPLSYLISGIFFILSIRSLSSPYTAREGNIIGIIGMLIAIGAMLFSSFVIDIKAPLAFILMGGIIGFYSAIKVKMTALPQMIAVFNGLGGLSAVLISFSELLGGSPSLIEISLGVIIGAIAFTGSMTAFAKLQGILPTHAITFKFQHIINLLLIILCTYIFLLFISEKEFEYFLWICGISLIIGITFVLPIGGADMPVIISILNSYSGWAAVGIGFSLSNSLLIIVGSIIGASGAILAYIMVKAMNRSLLNVLLGGFGNQKYSTLKENENKTATTGSPQDAAFIMENANKVIIVPGYGMAVAQAQHILRQMAEDLQKLYHVDVKFAIHPVAGRMPGHMNVLLAEANIDYQNVFELENINNEFETADVAYVIGANDITNPLAKTDSSSPIYGMPILNVSAAKTVFFVKRSLGSGYSGVDNPLFYADNTIMLYGDAKKVTEEIVNVLEKK